MIESVALSNNTVQRWVDEITTDLEDGISKAANPNVLTDHCVIHRQHLVAKTISGHRNLSLKTVIKTANKIKALALNTR